MTESKENLIGRQYFLEEIFENFEEYKSYLIRALALFREQDKRRNPTLQKYVPEYLEIQFNKTIKAPRLYFPRYQGTLVVELPDANASPKRKAFIRAKSLERYAGIVKINEIACADEFAMRMKVMEKS